MGLDFIAVGTRPLGARTSPCRQSVFGCLGIAEHGLSRVTNLADKQIALNTHPMLTAVIGVESNMRFGSHSWCSQAAMGGSAHLLVQSRP